jgi:hypothetical protein
MRYQVQVIAVKPCGCDSEGEIHALLEDGTEVWLCYQGSERQALDYFLAATLVPVDIVGRLCTATLVSYDQKELLFASKSCRFMATGKISNIERLSDEVLHLLDSTVALVFDNELGRDQICVGSCVSVVGELRAENWHA